MRQKFRKTHLKKNSWTARVLEELVETADDFFTFGYNPVSVIRFGFGGTRKIRDAKERKYRRDAIGYLQERGFVENRKIADNYRGNITKDGMREYFRLKLSQCELFEDGRVSVVVFDIPESQRRFRDEFRRLLKDISFIQIQRSVWISPFDVGDTFMQMLGKTKKKWIRCFVSREVR